MRNRSQNKFKRKVGRPSSKKSVSVEALRLCIKRLEANGYRPTRTTRQYLFKILQLILPSKSDGKGIPTRSFPTAKKVSELLKALNAVELISCPDWDSWKIANAPKARAFIPSSELILADLDGPRVYDFYDYHRHVYIKEFD